MRERKNISIAFYVEKPFHEYMLLPIYNEVKEEFPSLISDDLREIIAFQPSALFIADKCNKVFRRYLPYTFIIWTRHGFSTKNWSHECLERCDIACLSSEWFKDFFIQRGHSPRIDFWVTGFPPMDTVFRNSRKVSPDKREKTVLYAPTFDLNLAAEPVLGDSWIKKVLVHLPDLKILIKPHPLIKHVNPEWIGSWKEEAESDRRIRIIEPDENFYEIMIEGDILITDASSVMFPFLVLDRPLILVNNPGRFRDPKYDPQAPEWISRGMGSEVEDMDGLVKALKLNLSQPFLKNRERVLYRQRYLGNSFDGRVCERISFLLKNLLVPETGKRASVERIWRKKKIQGYLHSLILKCNPRYSILKE